MTVSFKEFVMAQDPKREINHSSGWSKCSVGDYCAEVLHTSRTYADKSTIRVSEIIEDEILYECLNAKGHAVRQHNLKWRICSFSTVLISTYGDIQEYYKGNLKLVEEPE